MTTSVSQAPWKNFITMVVIRIAAEIARPVPFRMSRESQPRSDARTCHQCRTIPSCERLKVTKTLMLYMSTRWVTFARV